VEEIETISRMIDRVSSMEPEERSRVLDKAKGRLRSAAGTKRSLKMEIRLVQDVAQRRRYESEFADLEGQLKTLQGDISALESEAQRGEIMKDRRHDPKASQEDGDKLLTEASNLQDKTQDSLSNTKNMIAQSKEVGISTLEELERQRNVIQNIERETNRIDDNLARSEVLLKQFGKRMASDHFIQCFALINCLLLLGVVLYAILKGGGLNTGKDSQPNSPVRFLRYEQP
jgi:novel plant SNARE